VVDAPLGDLDSSSEEDGRGMSKSLSATDEMSCRCHALVAVHFAE
jgi:hypothetical protein